MYQMVEKPRKKEKSAIIQRSSKMTMGYMSKHPDDDYKEKLFSSTVKGAGVGNEVHHIIPISVIERKVLAGAWGIYPTSNGDINSANNTITLPAFAPAALGTLPYHRRFRGDNHPTYCQNVTAATTNRHITSIPNAINYANTHLRPVITGFGHGNAIDNIPAASF